MKMEPNENKWRQPRSNTPPSFSRTITPHPFVLMNNSGNIALANPPALITWRHFRFLVMDAPSETNLSIYLQEMQKNSVKALVRVCEPTYNKAAVEAMGIKLYDWLFPDGEGPSDNIINAWLDLVGETFSLSSDPRFEKSCIAVHCVAGLGRAPVLVAIAFIEGGMSPLDAVMYIRERRRGAINNRQLKFLETYKRRSPKRSYSINSTNSCSIQ